MLRLRISLPLVLAAFAVVACRDTTIDLQDPSADAGRGTGAVALDSRDAARPAAPTPSLIPPSTATPTPAPPPGPTAAPAPAAAAPGANALAAIRGVQPGYVDTGNWFAARHVDRPQLLAFFASHGGSKLEGTRCQAVNVGAPPEPALACLDQRIDQAAGQVRDHVQFLVVRNGAPLIVGGLFVGYGSWTDPSIRFVDLAITVASDGLSFTLDDRGPPGARIPIAATGSLDPKTAEIFGCNQARDGKAVSADPAIAKGVAKLCAERGVWPWKNNHFFRPSKAPSN
jgi:hypothetical protein